MVFIRLDDAPDEGMADDVAFAELDDGYAFDVAQGIHGLDEARGFIAWEVDLGDIAGDDGLGVVTQAGQEHEHLFHGTVLGFIEDDEGVVQGAAAHVGEGGDFDSSSCAVLFYLLGGHHIVQGVVEWPEVGCDFFVEVTGQESQGFAGLDGGAGKNDA